MKLQGKRFKCNWVIGGDKVIGDRQSVIRYHSSIISVYHESEPEKK